MDEPQKHNSKSKKPDVKEIPRKGKFIEIESKHGHKRELGFIKMF